MENDISNSEATTSINMETAEDVAVTNDNINESSNDHTTENDKPIPPGKFLTLFYDMIKLNNGN